MTMRGGGPQRHRTSRFRHLPLALGLVVSACGGTAPPLSPPPSAASPSPSRSSSAPTPLENSTAVSPTVPTRTPGPPPTVAPLARLASPCTVPALAQWSLGRLAWQVITVPVQLTSLGSAAPEVRAGAGGILLFGAAAPADTRGQLALLTSAAAPGIAPLIMSDVEGGAVQRAANLLGPMPAARRLAETMSAAQIRSYAAGAGQRMRSIGITMDLAPVMDLDAGPGPSAGNPDGTRSFSANPQLAAADATAFAEGLTAAGIIPVAKHFPGLHGQGDNTDLGPAETDSWARLQQGGLVPFEVAIRQGLPAVMLSNAFVPGLSSRPAAVSAEVVAALRGQLGFTGLILTDSLTAGAIAHTGLSLPEAATAALRAGADMVLYDGAHRDAAADARTIAVAIEAAVRQGTLPRAQLVTSVGRILAAKRGDVCAAP